jgi:hypothetical protein
MDVGPSIRETLDSLLFCHVKSVAIDAVDIGERLYQVSRIGLVSSETGANRMSINGNVQTKQLPGKIINKLVFITKTHLSATLARK